MFLADMGQDSLWARQKQTLIHSLDIMGELYFKWSDVDFSDIYMVKYSSVAVLTGEKT